MGDLDGVKKGVVEGSIGIEKATEGGDMIKGAVDNSRRKFLGWLGKGVGLAAMGTLLPAYTADKPSGDSLEDSMKSKTPALTPEDVKVVEKSGVVIPEDSAETRDAYFYGVSVMMGLGIAVDVAVATLAMYRKFGSSRAKSAWIFGVGASHILLPVLSGAATAGAETGGEKIGYGEIAQRGLSAAGFAILAKFLYGEIKGDEEGEGEDVDVIGSLDASFLKYIAAVWSVSVDAAISGPAKWEQARTAKWGHNNILTSIVIGGLTVSLVAALALKGAEMLHKKYGDEGSKDIDKKLGKMDRPLLFVESLALNYFGTNALMNGTFKMDLSPASIAVLDTAFTATMFKMAKNGAKVDAPKNEKADKADVPKSEE